MVITFNPEIIIRVFRCSVGVPIPRVGKTWISINIAIALPATLNVAVSYHRHVTIFQIYFCRHIFPKDTVSHRGNALNIVHTMTGVSTESAVGQHQAVNGSEHATATVICRVSTEYAVGQRRRTIDGAQPASYPISN